MTASRRVRRRIAWLVFCTASAVAVGACVVAAVATGDRTSVGLTLVGGVIVVGIAAALMASIISPLPHPAGAVSRGSGGEAGGADFGGGGCGDGGGSC